jgi:hypothetical protein
MKIRPVGAELFHVDGRTETMKVTIAFRNFANEPKMPLQTCWKTVSLCVGWESNLCLPSRSQSLSWCSHAGFTNHCLFQVKKFKVRSTRLRCTKCVVSSSSWKGMLGVPTDTLKQSHYRPGQALRIPGGWGSQISRQSAHVGGKVVSPTHRPPLPQELLLLLLSLLLIFNCNLVDTRWQ